MSTSVPVSHSYPRLFTRQVIELWDYQWNPVHQRYDRVCFRPLHLFEDEANPQDPSDGEFYRPYPIMVNELEENVQRRMVPPNRPPPPNFGASPRPAIVAIPVRSPTVPEFPASPDPVEPYSPTDTPTKRVTPSPPPYSPNRTHCDRSYFVARQDHHFALPLDCPDNRPARPAGTFSPANPPLQPPPQPRRTPIRRRAPSPPRPVGRGREGVYPVGRGRSGPYVPPVIPSEASAFARPFQRARNLFADFVPSSSTSPPPMVRTFPGPPPPLPQPPRTPSPQPPRTPSPAPRAPSPPLPRCRRPGPRLRTFSWSFTNTADIQLMTGAT
ncbi:uncharacterized protein LOC128174710 [Crassostrea angulata]|uniref:uncharacterized protein LOC128174710 n=1 Tax=Magallana angulata TaxID=2784310 RepID=UPI0022B08E20|nr:uncharacterized protein LOC128174710 [Crassostrea angulata]